MQPEGTLWFGQALLPQGWAARVRIGVAGGRIAAVETGVGPQPADERAAIGLPGLPNLHSHAFQRGMAGLAEVRGAAQDSFWSWRELMYRFLDRLQPADVEAIAAQAYVEMLEAGFTRVGEFHYLHHAADGAPYTDLAEMSARIAAAADCSGIGLSLLPVFYAHSGFGGTPPQPAQRRFINDVDRYARLLEAARLAVAPLGDAIVGIAPHSLRAVTPAQLQALLPLAAGQPVHIHIAEQLREVEDCLAWSGQRPVEWLLAHAAVDARWCLVHATHMSADETVALARSGAVAGLCPITEANLGDGLFPAPEFLAAGGAFGIGSDSNVRIDAFEELRLLEYGQRLSRRARNVLAEGPQCSTGRTLYAGAVAGGARALGAAAGIAIGAPADVVAVDAQHAALVHRSGDALLDSLVFGGAQGAIDRVWRAGRKVVSEGRHLRREEIAERYRRTLARLLAA